MGMGPFTLQPGVPVDVVMAFVWARGADHLDSVARLKRETRPRSRSSGSRAATRPLRNRRPRPCRRRRPALAVGAVTPNPLHTTGQITVSLPAAARVRAWVLDARGQTVARLHDGVLGAGVHALPLEASGWASGAYAVRVSVGSETVARRFVVVR